MTYIPPSPPPTSLFTPGIYILQYPNQQIIGSGLTSFTFRPGEYNINAFIPPYNNNTGPYYLPPTPQQNPSTASNDITNIVMVESLINNSIWCTLDNPTGNFFPLGIIPYSIYVYVGSDWYDNPSNPLPYPDLNDWRFVRSLTDIGPGAWFTCDLLPNQILVWDETQLISPPISASLSGSYGFLQITGSAGASANITLTCVETSSTDPAGGKWIISNTATETKLY